MYSILPSIKRAMRSPNAESQLIVSHDSLGHADQLQLVARNTDGAGGAAAVGVAESPGPLSSGVTDYLRRTRALELYPGGQLASQITGRKLRGCRPHMRTAAIIAGGRVS